MNFRFLNAYESNIEPLLFGVAFDEHQRKKAIDAIMLAGKNTIDINSSDFAKAVRFKFRESASGKLLDAWVSVGEKEYRTIQELENICWTLIFKTAPIPS